jgi:hypothetical protein
MLSKNIDINVIYIGKEMLQGNKCGNRKCLGGVKGNINREKSHTLFA